MKQSLIQELRSLVQSNTQNGRRKGYVCIGYGSRSCPLSTKFGISETEVFSFYGGVFSGGYSGEDRGRLYYIKESIFSHLTGKNFSNSKADAESLLGKTVGWYNSNGKLRTFKVERFKVFTIQDLNGPKTSDVVERDGYCFCVGMKSTGPESCVPVELVHVVKAGEVILKQNYTAKITPGQIEVGCQTFDIEQVREIIRIHDSL